MRKHRYFWMIAIFLVCIPLFVQIFQKGLWLTDDGEWMVIRLSGFIEELRNHQLPVRWLGRLNHGYGYPVVIFLYPGYLYFGAIIHQLGFGIVDSLKLIFSFSLVTLGVGLFLWLKRLYDEKSAFIGAVAGIYSPYIFFDVFQRGSVGEVLALSLVPFFLLFVEEKKTLHLGLVYALIIISHNTIAFLFTPFLIAYTLLRGGRVITGLFFGLGLAAFFWIPALFEQQYVIFSKIKVADWGQYFLGKNTVHLVGVSSVAIFLMILFTMNDRKKINTLSLLMLITLGIVFFLVLPWSYYLWLIFPWSDLVQFPWRLLALSVCFFPFFVSLFFFHVHKKQFFLFLVVFLTASLGNFFPYFHLSRIDKGDAFYDGNDATTTVRNEYMPMWVTLPPTSRPANKIATGKNTTQVAINQMRSSYFDFNVDATEQDEVNIHTLYYPGWKVQMNGSMLSSLAFNQDGYIIIPVRPGKTNLVVSFSETPPRIFADMVSVASLVVIMILWIVAKSKVSR